ncbi:hypothetical protein [Rhodovulum sulfidophilum]|nr:hypothetical protein [Rhodovulum sulfidophilum]OLS48973.1 hypothetical protein BV379_12275 [Rhodovulum sulfidophilum]
MKRFALGWTDRGADRIEVVGQAGMSDRDKRPGPAFALMILCVPAGWLTLIAALLLEYSLLTAVVAMFAVMWGIFVLGLIAFLAVDALRARCRGSRREADAMVE